MSVEEREARIQFVMKRLKECESNFDVLRDWWGGNLLRQLACAAILAVMDFESEQREEYARRSQV